MEESLTNLLLRKGALLHFPKGIDRGVPFQFQDSRNKNLVGIVDFWLKDAERTWSGLSPVEIPRFLATHRFQRDYVDDMVIRGCEEFLRG